MVVRTARIYTLPMQRANDLQKHDVQDPHDLIHDAYKQLSHDQLVLFLTVRSLPTDGSDEELALRLTQFDFHTYSIGGTSSGGGMIERSGSPRRVGSCWKMNGHVNTIANSMLTAPGSSADGSSRPQSSVKPRQTPKLPDLPTELLAEILDQLGDWELSKAVGLPTSLSRPPEWNRASKTDEAMLSGFIPLIRAADPARNPPTKIGATLAIRFGYVRVLEMLYQSHRAQFPIWFRNDIIPICASHHSRTTILTWWKNLVRNGGLPAPRPSSIAEAIEGACRNGGVSSLDWWVRSGFELEYTEAALESASAKNHIAVLDWWKSSGLPLKIGRVMDTASSAGHVEILEWWHRSPYDPKYDKQSLHHASMHGKVDVLQWWLESGRQLLFDQDALTLATRHNRPEVLEWWDQSGLHPTYRMCDIEEALEDAIGGGEAAREWWRKKGVNFNANDTEWMKLQILD